MVVTQEDSFDLAGDFLLDGADTNADIDMLCDLAEGKMVSTNAMHLGWHGKGAGHSPGAHTVAMIDTLREQTIRVERQAALAQGQQSTNTALSSNRIAHGVVAMGGMGATGGTNGPPSDPVLQGSYPFADFNSGTFELVATKDYRITAKRKVTTSAPTSPPLGNAGALVSALQDCFNHAMTLADMDKEVVAALANEYMDTLSKTKADLKAASDEDLQLAVRIVVGDRFGEEPQRWSDLPNFATDAKIRACFGDFVRDRPLTRAAPVSINPDVDYLKAVLARSENRFLSNIIAMHVLPPVSINPDGVNSRPGIRKYERDEGWGMNIAWFNSSDGLQWKVAVAREMKSALKQFKRWAVEKGGMPAFALDISRTAWISEPEYMIRIVSEAAKRPAIGGDAYISMLEQFVQRIQKNWVEVPSTNVLADLQKLQMGTGMFYPLAPNRAHAVGDVAGGNDGHGNSALPQQRQQHLGTYEYPRRIPEFKSTSTLVEWLEAGLLKLQVSPEVANGFSSVKSDLLRLAVSVERLLALLKNADEFNSMFGGYFNKTGCEGYVNKSTANYIDPSIREDGKPNTQHTPPAIFTAIRSYPIAKTPFVAELRVQLLWLLLVESVNDAADLGVPKLTWNPDGKWVDPSRWVDLQAPSSRSSTVGNANHATHAPSSSNDAVEQFTKLDPVEYNADNSKDGFKYNAKFIKQVVDAETKEVKALIETANGSVVELPPDALRKPRADRLQLRLSITDGTTSEYTSDFFADELLPHVSVQVGHRLTVESADGKALCGTVISVDGAPGVERSNATLRVDNSTRQVTFDGAIGKTAPTSGYCYASGTHLMVHLNEPSADGKAASAPSADDAGAQGAGGSLVGWVDCIVLQYIPSMQVHKIRTFNGTETMIDLNDFNHTPQLFASVAAFVAERDKYLSGLVEELQYATDAITGKKLNVEEQLVKINMDPTGMSGVVREGWSDVDQVLTLAPKLAEPSPNRHRGIHNVQPVLMSAKAGTGKSWCVHQLAHKLAKVTLEESNSPRESPLPPPSPPALPCTLGEGLPIVIPVQKLARILRRQRNTIKSEFRNKIPTKMLQQLEELRQTKGIGNADKKLGAEGKVLLAASRKVRQDADSTNLIAEYIKTEYVTSLLPPSISMTHR